MKKCFQDGASRATARVVPGLSLLVALAASAYAADDSVWINRGIQDAIKAGKKEYVIPAGTFNLSNPVRVPDGVRGFTLRGMGSSRTRFISDAKISYAIMAGVSPVLHNNWGVTNQKNVAVSSVLEGAMTLRLQSMAGIKAGDYLALWDDSYVEHSQFPGGDRNMNHAELTKVTAVDAANKAVRLDRPTGRSYNANARVALTNDYVVTDLKISDMGFDATIAGTDTRNNGIVQVGLSDRVKLANLDVARFCTRAVLVNWSRDVEVFGVTIADGQTPQYAGCAYGVTLCRSRNVVVKNCYVTGSRHGYVSHNGTTDALFQDCVADGDNGNFDTHGCDERRISYLRCRGTGSFNVGNGAWQAGGTNFRVTDCEFGGAFHYGINTTDIEFRNTTIYAGISLDSPGGSKTSAKLGARFYDCAFKSIPGGGFLWEGGNFGRIELNHCTLSTDVATWGAILNVKKVSGALLFKDCQLISNITRNYVPVWVASPGLDLTMIGCHVLSRSGTVTGVQFGAGFGATASLYGNTFYTSAKNPKFFVNDTAKAVTNVNNRTLDVILGIWMGFDGNLGANIP